MRFSPSGIRSIRASAVSFHFLIPLMRPMLSSVLKRPSGGVTSPLMANHLPGFKTPESSSASFSSQKSRQEMESVLSDMLNLMMYLPFLVFTSSVPKMKPVMTTPPMPSSRVLILRGSPVKS